MNENKLAHLGFIQLVINRLASNSFIIKGWCITLVAALTAISLPDNMLLILIAYFPIIIFWLLDTYYLWQEKLFRGHYDEVRIKKEKEIDFGMKFSQKTINSRTYLKTAFSKTILPFYLILLGTVVIFMCIEIYG